MNARWNRFLVIGGIVILMAHSICSIPHAQMNLPLPKPRGQQSMEQLRVILQPLKKEFDLGEPVDLRLRLRNIGRDPLAIIRPSVKYDLKGWVLSGEVTGPDGTKRVVTSARRTATLPDPLSGDVVHLKRREEVTLEIRFANNVDTDRSTEPWDAWNLGYDPSKEKILGKCFPVPGEYKIVVSVDRYLEFITLKEEGREQEVGAWRGKVSSNEVKVRVTGGNL
jgi:hypothetical protein